MVEKAAAAAAAAKSLQSSPTLCDPIDGSPPGSSIPGILQARILEWVAISFSMKRLRSDIIWGVKDFKRMTKLLEENTGRTLSHINHSKSSFNPSPRIMEIKTKINKGTYLNSKAFVQQRKQ